MTRSALLLVAAAWLAMMTVVVNGQVEVTASIGIAFARRSELLAEEILHAADSAMYQAKRKGGARQQVLDMGEQRQVEHRVSLGRDLRHAPAGHQLHTEYQPIVGTVDRRIVGVEALLRWRHPTLGFIAPSTVIPLAEQSGMIVDIGLWVLKQACLDLARWAGRQCNGMTMAVNVSAFQLMSPDFAVSVGDVLRATKTNPECVTLEVTESVFVQDSQRALVVLSDLKHLGVGLALDDFGTGYSSLRYLSRFPVDIVKIDQSFVVDLARNPANRAIVNAVVDLAHTLGLTVVAEGVETVDQFHEVASLGCDACQGYYFARPMSADALDATMSHRVAGLNPRLPRLSSAA